MINRASGVNGDGMPHRHELYPHPLARKTPVESMDPTAEQLRMMGIIVTAEEATRPPRRFDLHRKPVYDSPSATDA